jgi:hypothetical protein
MKSFIALLVLLLAFTASFVRSNPLIDQCPIQFLQATGVDDIVPLAGSCLHPLNLGQLAGMIAPGSTCYDLGLFDAATYGGITTEAFSDGESVNMLAIGAGVSFDPQQTSDICDAAINDAKWECFELIDWDKLVNNLGLPELTGYIETGETFEDAIVRIKTLSAQNAAEKSIACRGISCFLSGAVQAGAQGLIPSGRRLEEIDVQIDLESQVHRRLNTDYGPDCIFLGASCQAFDSLLPQVLTQYLNSNYTDALTFLGLDINDVVPSVINTQGNSMPGEDAIINAMTMNIFGPAGAAAGAEIQQIFVESSTAMLTAWGAMNADTFSQLLGDYMSDMNQTRTFENTPWLTIEGVMGPGGASNFWQGVQMMLGTTQPDQIATAYEALVSLYLGGMAAQYFAGKFDAYPNFPDVSTVVGMVFGGEAAIGAGVTNYLQDPLQIPYLLSRSTPGAIKTVMDLGTLEAELSKQEFQDMLMGGMLMACMGGSDTFCMITIGAGCQLLGSKTYCGLTAMMQSQDLLLDGSFEGNPGGFAGNPIAYFGSMNPLRFTEFEGSENRMRGACGLPIRTDMPTLAPTGAPTYAPTTASPVIVPKNPLVEQCYHGFSFDGGVQDIVPLAGSCLDPQNLGQLAGMIAPGSTCYDLGLFDAATYGGITTEAFSDGESINMLAIGAGVEFSGNKTADICDAALADPKWGCFEYIDWDKLVMNLATPELNPGAYKQEGETFQDAMARIMQFSAQNADEKGIACRGIGCFLSGAVQAGAQGVVAASQNVDVRRRLKDIQSGATPTIKRRLLGPPPVGLGCLFMGAPCALFLDILENAVNDFLPSAMKAGLTTLGLSLADVVPAIINSQGNNMPGETVIVDTITNNVFGAVGQTVGGEIQQIFVDSSTNMLTAWGAMNADTFTQLIGDFLTDMNVTRTQANIPFQTIISGIGQSKADTFFNNMVSTLQNTAPDQVSAVYEGQVTMLLAPEAANYFYDANGYVFDAYPGFPAVSDVVGMVFGGETAIAIGVTNYLSDPVQIPYLLSRAQPAQAAAVVALGGLEAALSDPLFTNAISARMLDSCMSGSDTMCYITLKAGCLLQGSKAYCALVDMIDSDSLLLDGSAPINPNGFKGNPIAYFGSMAPETFTEFEGSENRMRGSCGLPIRTDMPTLAPTMAPTDAPTLSFVPSVAPTDAPTSLAPTSAAPTSAAPTSAAPTSAAPTSAAPTSAAPTSAAPTSAAPTTGAPTTSVQTIIDTTDAPTSAAPTSAAPTSAAPTSGAPTAAVVVDESTGTPTVTSIPPTPEGFTIPPTTEGQTIPPTTEDFELSAANGVFVPSLFTGVCILLSMIF